jgi:hypothetical protein
MDKVNKYNNSLIYILKPKIINENDKLLIYYGSTLSKDLNLKLLIHIEDFKRNSTYNITDNYKTSYKLFEKYGEKGIDIELIKVHNCKNQYKTLLTRYLWKIRAHVFNLQKIIFPLSFTS